MITIPKTVPLLKQEIRDYIYSKYDRANLIEGMTREQLDRFPDREEDPVKTIGMWMSGGADSSLLAYLLCKKIRDENLDIKFQGMSVRRGRPSNPMYAAGVLDFIEETLEVDFINEHIVYYPPKDDEHYMEIEVFMDKDYENFRDRTFQVLYSGITCNPPKDELPLNEERTRDEDAERPTCTYNGLGYYMNPFFVFNKKRLAQIYEEEGLTDTLFPITRSCEGSAGYTVHCGKCWWCLERYWAFGRLV